MTTMNLQIELIVFLFLLLLLFVWMLWHKLTRSIAKKRYKPEEDKSKYGEEKRRAELEGRIFEPAKAVVYLPGLAPTERRELLQDATPDSTGEDIEPVRRDNKSSKGILAKLGRKK